MTPSSDNPKAELLDRLRRSAQEKTFIRLVLGKCRGGGSLVRVVVAPLVLRGADALSFRYDYEKKQETKNTDLDQGLLRIDELLGNEFLSATLFTATEDVSLLYSRKRVPRLASSRPTAQAEGPVAHNRQKEHIVAQDAPYLHHLGITDATGRLRGPKSDKFRQINKFVEIVDALVRQSTLADRHDIKVVDYGSGKNYLTFALYDYFSRRAAAGAEVIGVEARGELVEEGNRLARQAGFARLSFQEGLISSVPCPDAQVVVALHACDTATDDAIARAVLAGAEIVALAPCCQKYVRARMQVPGELEPILKHGVLQERFAESLTDGLRALVLEACGYRAKVFEFIAVGHTAKNVMISGTRRSPSPERRAAAVAEIARIKALFQLPDFHLDRVLDLGDLQQAK